MTAGDRYLAALHAMQTGVRFDVEKELPLTPPDELRHLKHVRVGINSAMVEHSALATLLIEKGLLTREEYETALADMMEAEQRRYEERLGVKLA